MEQTFVRLCSVKKLFSDISQSSQGNTCVSDSFLTSPSLIYLNQCFQVSQLLKYDANIVIT